MSQQIKLTDIRLAGTNTRVQLDRQAVADYGDQLDEGSPLPPIDLYHDPLENPAAELARHRRHDALQLDQDG